MTLLAKQKKRTKFLQGVAVFVPLALFVYFAVPSINYTNCGNKRYFERLVFQGIVVAKFLDRTQHSAPIVVISGVRGGVDSIDFFGERTGIFEKLQVADTLVKKAGTSRIGVLRKGVVAPFGIADFHCDSVLFEKENSRTWLYQFVGTIPEH